MICTKFFLKFAAVLVLCSCAREEAPSEVVYARRPTPYHVVKKDDTVASVAAKYSMKENDLISINKLKEPYTLIVGQRLLVNHNGSDSQKSASDVTVTPLDEASVESNGTSPLGKLTDGASDVAKTATDTTKTALEQVPSVTGKEAATTQKAVAPQPVTYRWPIKGDIITKFGQTLSDGSMSDGINIKAPANLDVIAAAPGIVKDAGQRIPAYGNMVILQHSDGKMTIYAHLKETSVAKPAPGKVVEVSANQVIGRVGDTGTARGNPQLFFQMRGSDLKPIDPTTVLP